MPNLCWFENVPACNLEQQTNRSTLDSLSTWRWRWTWILETNHSSTTWTTKQTNSAAFGQMIQRPIDKKEEDQYPTSYSTAKRHIRSIINDKQQKDQPDRPDPGVHSKPNKRQQWKKKKPITQQQQRDEHSIPTMHLLASAPTPQQSPLRRAVFPPPGPNKNNLLACAFANKCVSSSCTLRTK